MFDEPLFGSFGAENRFTLRPSRSLVKKMQQQEGKLTTGNKDDMQLDQRERKFQQTGTLNDPGAKRCIESRNLGILGLLMSAVGLLSGSFSGARCIHEIRL
jgi:hypothetical protein